MYVHKDINTTHAVPFEKTRKITIEVQNSHAKERDDQTKNQTDTAGAGEPGA